MNSAPCCCHSCTAAPSRSLDATAPAASGSGDGACNCSTSARKRNFTPKANDKEPCTGAVKAAGFTSAVGPLSSALLWTQQLSSLLKFHPGCTAQTCFISIDYSVGGELNNDSSALQSPCLRSHHGRSQGADRLDHYSKIRLIIDSLGPIVRLIHRVWRFFIGASKSCVHAFIALSRNLPYQLDQKANFQTANRPGVLSTQAQRSEVWLSELKHMPLAQASLDIRLEQRSDLDIDVVLESDYYALFVVVESELSGRFSANGFTVYPEEPKCISFTADGEVSDIEVFRQGLHVTCLNC